MWTMAMNTLQHSSRLLFPHLQGGLTSPTSLGCCEENPGRAPEHREHIAACLINKPLLARTTHRLDEASAPRLQSLVLMPRRSVSVALRSGWFSLFPSQPGGHWLLYTTPAPYSYFLCANFKCFHEPSLGSSGGNAFLDPAGFGSRPMIILPWWSTARGKGGYTYPRSELFWHLLKRNPQQKQLPGTKSCPACTLLRLSPSKVPYGVSWAGRGLGRVEILCSVGHHFRSSGNTRLS